MVDRRAAETQRTRIENLARGLGPDERLWFEVHPAGHKRRGRRWKAAVCRPERVTSVLAGAEGDGAVCEVDHPSQLPEWLDLLRLHPVQPLPADWQHMMFFGCDVEVHPPDDLNA
ncbi:hypothetical protein [Sinomonas gamaensis]|uniref:hypothetical protein n=1 Tax=Sinomonas gamaensis TaxID=2565624 RepID=UPI001107BC9C|nr:hypothetical protein [Sinomonas gamaensis]